MISVPGKHEAERKTKGGPESLHEPKIRDALDVSSICPCGCFLLLLAGLNTDINMRMCFCCLYGVMATQYQLPFADFDFFSFREWLGPPFCFALDILAFIHEHFHANAHYQISWILAE